MNTDQKFLSSTLKGLYTMTKWDLECKDGWTLQISMWYTILAGKNTLSQVMQKKNSTSFHDKCTQQTKKIRKLPQHNKNHTQKSHSESHTQWFERSRVFPLLETRWGCLLLSFLFNIVGEVLAWETGQEETVIQTGKE